MREALYYTSKQQIICQLCPHFCRLQEGERFMWCAAGMRSAALFLKLWSLCCSSGRSAGKNRYIIFIRVSKFYP